MTQEEKMLVDLYRKAGYNKRLALFTLLSAEGAPPAPAKPPAKPPRSPKPKRS